jgi:hypothetical protein
VIAQQETDEQTPENDSTGQGNFLTRETLAVGGMLILFTVVWYKTRPTVDDESTTANCDRRWDNPKFEDQFEAAKREFEAGDYARATESAQSAIQTAQANKSRVTDAKVGLVQSELDKAKALKEDIVTERTAHENTASRLESVTQELEKLEQTGDDSETVSEAITDLETSLEEANTTIDDYEFDSLAAKRERLRDRLAEIRRDVLTDLVESHSGTIQMSENGVHVTKRLAVDDELGPSVVYDFNAESDEPVEIRLVDSLPDAVDPAGIEIPAERGGKNWSFEEGKLVFQRGFGASESDTSLYGLRSIAETDLSAYLTEPDIDVS